jgi:hypothetical protein
VFLAIPRRPHCCTAIALRRSGAPKLHGVFLAGQLPCVARGSRAAFGRQMAMASAPRYFIGAAVKMPRHVSGWRVAAILFAVSGPLSAAPEECLSFRANAEVASCANRYAPNSTSPRPRSEPASTPRQASQGGRNPDLRTVPVVPKSAKTVVSPEPESPTLATIQDERKQTIVASAVGGSLLVLVGYMIWRAGSAGKLSCRWCGAPIARNAKTCKFCLRHA